MFIFYLLAADDELCLSRLITYASDQGKKYPMEIGEDYSEEVRHQMADFLVSFLIFGLYVKLFNFYIFYLAPQTFP